MIEVKKLDSEEWKCLSEYAHKICFKEKRDWDFDRIDFALLCYEGGNPMGYVTCREIDKETLYWQYGGSFDETRGTIRSWACYEKLTNFVREMGYARITTLIENTNTVMIKFAMKMGYLIQGLRYFKGHVLLENILEFNKGGENGTLDGTAYCGRSGTGKIGIN